jgi:hypothetical protein
MSSKSYEHSILTFDPTTWNFDSIDEPGSVVLAKHGSEGWELVSAVPGPKSPKILMFFKRKNKGKH